MQLLLAWEYCKVNKRVIRATGKYTHLVLEIVLNEMARLQSSEHFWLSKIHYLLIDCPIYKLHIGCKTSSDAEQDIGKLHTQTHSHISHALNN